MYTQTWTVWSELKILISIWVFFSLTILLLKNKKKTLAYGAIKIEYGVNDTNNLVFKFLSGSFINDISQHGVETHGAVDFTLVYHTLQHKARRDIIIKLNLKAKYIY